MMNLVRRILSALILLWDRLLPAPVEVSRDVAQQSQVDSLTRSLTLYQFVGCPFCVKVRRQIRRLGLSIELKDVLNSTQAHEELMAGGGEYQVPCLRIVQDDGQIQWLYESDAINSWLTERFAN
jgi:glutaredoxin